MLLKLDTGGPDAISARMLKHTDSAMLTQNYYKQKKLCWQRHQNIGS